MSLWSPNLISVQENSSREMKLVDKLNIPSPFGLHLMPAGKSEPVGQCAILRNVERAEAPVRPVLKPKQMERTQKCISTIDRHNGEGWKCAAKNHIAGESMFPTSARAPDRLAADWTKIWTEA